ncbi:GntR family transcriptional regulator [uncultured Bosea sp.]|uniref:GntR family transcriptional regulator n=1 Tax=uncultured Bosea sp. TaxID=211457 RepID=UPI0025E50174|nr:GntR family transcriptional regulator [uncultured Bosea sp.]
MSLSLASPAVLAGASAAGRVEAELRRAIIALELPPGTRLSEQEIALKYGVSRQPVREALIALARTRLVDVQPQRGTVVVKFSVRKMMEARFIREAVEVAIVREACKAFSPQSRQRIADLLEVQEKAAGRDDHASFQRYDELFHVELAEGVGMPLAWEAIRDIKAHMDRVCQLTLPGTDVMLSLVEQHRRIMTTIDAQDAAQAELAMRHHLTEILRALPKTEANHPDLFE